MLVLGGRDLAVVDHVLGVGRRRYCGVEHVSRGPRPSLDGLIDDLHSLGAGVHARPTLLQLPPALLIVNLGVPFRIRAGADEGIPQAEEQPWAR